LAHRQVRLVVLLVPLASAAAVAEEAPEVALGAATLAFALEVVRSRAAGVDQAQREIEVAALAGGAVELDEGQLDLLMAVVAALGRAAGAELAVDEVGVAAHHLQQGGLAGGLVVGDARLDEVPGAVQLVGVAQIGEALAGFDDGEVDVQVAVVLLRACEERDRLVHGRVQVGVVLAGERVGGGLDPLGDVRLPEDVRFALVAGLPGEFERLELAAGAELVLLVGDGLGAGDLAARGPEGVVDGDVRDRQRGAAGGGHGVPFGARVRGRMAAVDGTVQGVRRSPPPRGKRFPGSVWGPSASVPERPAAPGAPVRHCEAARSRSSPATSFKPISMRPWTRGLSSTVPSKSPEEAKTATGTVSAWKNPNSGRMAC